MTGRPDMEKIFDKANKGQKLSSNEQFDLDRAARVAGSGYGSDARRAKEAQDRRR